MRASCGAPALGLKWLVTTWVSEISMTLEGYSRTWWDERTTAVSAVVDMVMNSENNAQQQKEFGDRRMLFQSESESIAIGARIGALAPKVVHAKLEESIVSD